MTEVIGKEAFFDGKDGAKIYEQIWLPEEDPKAVLLIIHGYAEHCGRYQHVAEYFCGKGLACAGLDHRGHGKSSGKDTELDSFEDYLVDLEAFIGRVKSQFPGKPVFLLGHSMGGAILAAYAITRQPQVNGLLFSGPAVMISEEISPFMIKISTVLGGIFPRLKTIKLDGDAVSRDPEVVALYNSDPLNYRGGIPARTGSELNKATQFIQENMGKIARPTLIMFGTEDKLADPRGGRMLYEKVQSEDKSLKAYEGLYHEILNEPEKEEVMGDMLEWIEKHI